MPIKFVPNPTEHQFKIIHWGWDDISDWSHEEDVPLVQAGWGHRKEFLKLQLLSSYYTKNQVLYTQHFFRHTSLHSNDIKMIL